MKIRFLLSALISIFCIYTVQSQGNVSINHFGLPPHPSSILDISSFDQGVLIPRMESWVKFSIINPAEGLIVCDTTTKSLWVYANHQWEELAMKYNTHWTNDFGIIHNIGNLASDDFVFGSPQLDDDGNANHRKRMFFDKSKGAFRAGEAYDFGSTAGEDESKRWDADSIGTHSVAIGASTLAKGVFSVAIGGGARATGYSAISIGNGTIASGNGSVAIGATPVATGSRSFSCNSTNYAKGYASFSSGEVTQAVGDFSASFGKYTVAKAYSSIALGWGNVGSGDPLNWVATDPILEVGVSQGSPKNALTIIKDGSLIAGSHSISDDAARTYDNTRMYFYKPKAAFRAGELYDVGTTPEDESKNWDVDSLGHGSLAIGRLAHAPAIDAIALGGNARARGYGSVAIGNTVFAKGTAAVALGISNANGDRSFAAGSTNNANGYASSTMGELTVANGKFSTSTGERTLAQAYASVATGKFNVGDGDPLNWVLTDPLFEIGNAPNLSQRQNAFTILKGGTMISGSHQVDDDPTRTSDNKRMYFHQSQGAFRAGGAIDDPMTGFNEDTYFDKTELGDFSTAFGLNSRATSYGAFAAGLGSVASDTGSTALGIAYANGKYATAVGYTSHANGNFSFAAGDSDATGQWSSALGLSDAGGQWSTAGGNGTASAIQSTAFGTSSATSTAATAMGIATASGSYSTALGYARSESYANTAIGFNNVGGGSTHSWVATDPLFEVGNGDWTTASNALTVLKNARVGINTSFPQSMLHIDQTSSGPGSGILLHLPGLGHWETSVASNKDYNFYFNNLLQAYLTDEGRLYLPHAYDVGLSTDGSLVIGQTSGWNLSIDDNEIMARNNSFAHDLLLQKDGGRVGIGTSPFSTLDVEGNFTVGSNYAGSLTAPPNGAIIEGYVGIGTHYPYNRLDIAGNIAIGSSYAGTATFAPLNGAIIEGNVGIGTPSVVNRLDVEGGLAVGASYSGSWTAPVNGAIVEGYLGVGSTAPSHQLTVYSANSETMRLIGPYSFGYGARLNFGDGDYVYIDEPTDDNMEIRANTITMSGDVSITGNMSKGSGSFRIDHPLEPEEKFLYHSFVESPDMMNLYNGVVLLDSTGAAVVILPDWFEALNRDFRYQLTAIGAPAPNLYISQEIKNNMFEIAGGEPGKKISWEVTGIRKDPYANQNRIQVEEDKPEHLKGTYLHPEAYDVSTDQRIENNKK